MAMININDNPSDRDLRQFAAIWFPLFWAAIATIVYFQSGNVRAAAVLLGIGLLLGGIGAYRVAFIRPIYLIWLYAAFPIGWTVSHILLGLIFYGLMTPIAIVMRLVGYDPLQRRIDRSAESYWAPIEQPRQKSDYFRQA